VLYKPADGKNERSQHPKLKWAGAVDAANYEIELYLKSRKGDPVWQTWTGDTHTRTPDLELGKKYFWRVRACSDYCSVWTDFRRFRVRE